LVDYSIPPLKAF